MINQMPGDGVIQYFFGRGEALINLRLVLSRNNQPDLLSRQAEFGRHFVERDLGSAVRGLQRISAAVQSGKFEIQHRAGAKKDDAGQQKRGPQAAALGTGTRGQTVRAPGFLRCHEKVPPMKFRLAWSRLAAVGKERRQVNHDHYHRGQGDASMATSRPSWPRPGVVHKVEHQERAPHRRNQPPTKCSAQSHGGFPARSFPDAPAPPGSAPPHNPPPAPSVSPRTPAPRR